MICCDSLKLKPGNPWGLQLAKIWQCKICFEMLFQGRLVLLLLMLQLAQLVAQEGPDWGTCLVAQWGPPQELLLEQALVVCLIHYLSNRTRRLPRTLQI